MRRLPSALLLALLLAPLLEFLPHRDALAQSGSPMPIPAQRIAAPPAGDSRLDETLRAVVARGDSARVIVLGRTQLFAPIGGLEAFQRAHDRDDRRTLRLSAAEIRAASRLDDVAFVYAGGEPPPRASGAGAEPILLVPDEPAPAFSAADKRIAWNVAHLNAPRAWTELGATGDGAVIAVLDNGANYAHTDLRSHLWRNRGEIANNGIDDDGNGLVDDVHGYDFGSMSPNVRNTGTPRQHGTMTSGIALGDGTGGTVTGVAPRARLMLLQITGGNVDESGNRPVAAALAYQYALEHGADILSMSFSLPRLGHLRGYWRMMSDHAVAAGLLLVGGAGNFRTTEPLPVQHQSPKDVPSVISVGGIDTLDVLRPFSSMGPAEWSTVALYGDHPLPAGLVKPDLVAFPGEGYPVLGLTDAHAAVRRAREVARAARDP
jgi:subtilisin family serine protease